VSRHRKGSYVGAVALLVLLIILSGWMFRPSVRITAPPSVPPTGDRAAIAMLPAAIVRTSQPAGTITVDLPPVDLPGRAPGEPEPMIVPPVVQATMPINMVVTGYQVEIVDSTGQRMPQEMLHHFNLNDPDHRELFLPISLHILAASRETPTVSVPWLLFGLPVQAGQRFIASAMLANPTPDAYHGLRVRLVMHYHPSGRPWPLFRAYPWVMDVLFPLGHPPGGSKAFDLPPGRSVKSWEARPAVPGTIIGMGGHLHDYGVSLELTDVTTGKVLGRDVPVRDSVGHVELLPTVLFYRWYRLGVHITPSHTYRVSVVYDNPTGQTIHNGGMGALAGMFIPDRGVEWPAVDPNDTLYQKDLHDTMWALAHTDIRMMMEMTHESDHQH
jgi:hypothetical protein